MHFFTAHLYFLDVYYNPPPPHRSFRLQDLCPLQIWKSSLVHASIYIKESSGPSTDSWGTPLPTSFLSDKQSFTITLCFLLFGQLSIHAGTGCFIPWPPVLLTSPLNSINSCWRSLRTTTTDFLSSTLDLISSATCIKIG